ncbi:NAD(P)H-dependent oxidoreductase (plasmid) [Deinococcus taeanensis]|uniref:NAD(P)H-dependent oxidoreductase n=1 Tax=Deinococcus taeanensis TaxID=2737050 RepID=UPI001CDCC314|nr:NAD(P)H-dependent oxidoreductase [Deinococcus taeanensis]UBV44357.1 NAD(P)H-dependent oxidoreductase [Deinococcus taeanensis]
MNRVLFIQGNPKGPGHSTALQLGHHFLRAYQEAQPGAEVSVLDLYAGDVPLIDADVLTGWGKLAATQALSAQERRKVERLSALVDQFLAADVIVFAAPMWNFGYPPMVKAYMDAVAVAGRTFQYTAQGPVGLAHGKRAVILESRGSIWTDAARQGMVHSTTHLRLFLNFLGVTEVNVVVAEGMDLNPAARADILDAAKKRAAQLALGLAAPPVPAAGPDRHARP